MGDLPITSAELDAAAAIVQVHAHPDTAARLAARLRAAADHIRPDTASTEPEETQP